MQARASDGLALACMCAAVMMVDALRTRETERAQRGRARAEATAAARQRELAEVRERLERSDKLTSLGMMAAGVAHEINNPMSYVTSNVQALLDDLRDVPALPEGIKAYRDEILPETLDGIQRVNTIVADLRRFAREDPGAMVEFDLNEHVSAALRIARSQLQLGVDLRVHLSRLPLAIGRPQQLTQVLLNLVVNAGQAIEVRGTVTVATRADPDEFHIEVRDTGSGMPPAVVEKLFQPFFTTKPVGKGTGLGLAVAHGIVRAHGGRIEVASRVGVGTTFWIHLPRVPPAARTGAVRPANGPLALATPTPTPPPRTGTC
jgi:signal transduction histidine kinase